MIEPTTATIGSHTYQLTRLPATDCMKWQARLLRVLSPLLRELGASVDTSKGLMDANIASALGGLTAGVAAVVEQVQQADPDLKLVTDLLALATVRHGRGDLLKLDTPAAIDLHFGHDEPRAPITDMYLVAYEVVKANHFLPPQLTGVLKAARANMTETLNATDTLTSE